MCSTTVMHAKGDYLSTVQKVLSQVTVFKTVNLVKVNAVLVSAVKQVASHKLVMCQLVQCVDKDNKLCLCRHSYSVCHFKRFKLVCRNKEVSLRLCKAASLSSLQRYSRTQ